MMNRRLVMFGPIVACVFSSLALVPSPVLADVSRPFEAIVELDPSAPVNIDTSTSVQGTADFRTGFVSLDTVCFTFHFGSDPLDPGDELLVTPEGNLGGFGFLNGSSKPQNDRTVCLGPNDPLLALFFDGVQNFSIVMNSGSVTIAHLNVTAVGVAA